MTSRAVDEIALTEHARLVLERRYLRLDDQQRAIETPAEMFRRVADNVAVIAASYGGDPEVLADAAYAVMARLEFLPNSPTLMNAGAELQQLAACFVLPVDDSLAGIFETLKEAALIHQSGGGTGFAFSHLRPANDVVHSTHGVASGPVSFMEVFDAATETIRQGGRRRGANMAILRVDHPDVERFVRAKAETGKLHNFNLSVAASDAFMRAVEDGDDYELVNPRSGEIAGTRGAREMFELIAQAAWEVGDPGLVFIDAVDRANPTPKLGALESTNPCGEQPLLAHESCTLGSIDVSKFAGDGGEIDWDRLGETVDLAVHFLDNVIDANCYPTPEIATATKRTRKIGLGVMGFAGLLSQGGVRYDSEEALAKAAELMRFISERADAASAALAEERGAFPSWTGSIFEPKGVRYRNATRTTIAPTGTLSLIANCSSGIEPVFGLAFRRRHFLDADDADEVTEFIDVDRVLQEIGRAEGWWSEEIRDHLLAGGSLAERTDVPDAAKELFVTAHEIAPESHVRMQAAFQRHTDNAVSKTINFPKDASTAEIADAYLLAWREGCKGITVYRDGSQDQQVLSHLTVD